MMTQDEIEQAESDGQKADRVFVASGPRKFRDIKLHPFSPSRDVASQAMGLHYSSIGDAGLERMKRTRIYPGALRDVVIVLWLCSVSDEEVDDAGIEPKAAARKAVAWGDQQGILDPSTTMFSDAYKMFLEIMDGVWSGRVKPQKKIDTEDNQTSLTQTPSIPLTGQTT